MVDLASRYRFVPPPEAARGMKRVLRRLERGVHKRIIQPLSDTVPGLMPTWHRAARQTRAEHRRRVTGTILFRSIAVTMLGVLIFSAGLVFVGSNRKGLVHERISALTSYSRLIADSVAEQALKTAEGGTGLVDPRNPVFLFDHGAAERMLRRLVKRSNYRVRIFDKRGVLVADSARIDSKGQVEWYDLSAPHKPFSGWELIDGVLDWIAGQMRGRQLLEYREEPNGLLYEEVRSVLEVRTDKPAEYALRKTEDRRLIMSVAVPIANVQVYYGALLVSTDGSDVEDALRAERKDVIQILLVAIGVSLLSAIFYAQNIVRPIRQLAKAADRVRRARPGTAGTERVRLPDFRKRADEIGDLAGSLRDMTVALYDRIDAIEQFAADVSHEIKNPLTSLRSAVETLSLARDPDAVARLLAIIQDDVKRIDRLITDISDASRLDAELSREAFRVVDVARLLDSILTGLGDTGAARGVELKLSVETGALHESALQVNGIESRLGQVFRNILDNALSFSPADGVILVSAALIPDRRAPAVRITIEDEGPGIPEESLENIFRRFYTQRPEAADFGKNSGLGLSISKQIIEAHSGRIHAENRKDAQGNTTGARFVVTLPLAMG